MASDEEFEGETLLRPEAMGQVVGAVSAFCMEGVSKHLHQRSVFL